MDLVPGYRHLLAGWRCPRDPDSLVGSAKRVAAHHPVPFGDPVLNGKTAIREGRKERDGDVIVFLLVHYPIAWKVTSVVRGKEIIPADPFPLIQEFVDIPTGDSLVGFCC